MLALTLEASFTLTIKISEGKGSGSGYGLVFWTRKLIHLASVFAKRLISKHAKWGMQHPSNIFFFQKCQCAVQLHVCVFKVHVLSGKGNNTDRYWRFDSFPVSFTMFTNHMYPSWHVHIQWGTGWQHTIIKLVEDVKTVFPTPPPPPHPPLTAPIEKLAKRDNITGESLLLQDEQERPLGQRKTPPANKSLMWHLDYNANKLLANIRLPVKIRVTLTLTFQGLARSSVMVSLDSPYIWFPIDG